MACAFDGGKALETHGNLLRNQPPEDTAAPLTTSSRRPARRWGSATASSSA
jgi:hypothetical protein